MKKFDDPAVAETFAAYSPPARARLKRLRALIFKTAAETDGVGALQETLKWGQPSYLTPETKSGTTLRIDALKDGSGGYALYVPCQTNLVERFRALYAETLTFEGNRAIVFAARDDMPAPAVRHCIAMALTYHRDKKRVGARMTACTATAARPCG